MKYKLSRTVGFPFDASFLVPKSSGCSSSRSRHLRGDLISAQMTIEFPFDASYFWVQTRRVFVVPAAECFFLSMCITRLYDMPVSVNKPHPQLDIFGGEKTYS